MSYSQSPPLVQDEWLTEGVPAEAKLRDLDGRSERRVPEPTFGRMGLQAAAERPSAIRRLFRFVFRFVIAVSIGVGGTLAAQTDVAKEWLSVQAPTLAWILSFSPARSFAGAAPAPQVGPFNSPPTFDLDALRRSLDQIAARQDQMAQAMAGLQGVEEDIRQKLSLMPASSPPPPQAATPQARPPQVRAPLSTAQPAPVPRTAPGALAPVPTR